MTSIERNKSKYQYYPRLNYALSWSFIRTTRPLMGLFSFSSYFLPRSLHHGCYLLQSPSYTLSPSVPVQWLPLFRKPSPIQMPSLQGSSLSSHRHRIKAWKITLLRLYRASIALGQRTLNCNSTTVEKKKVNWAHQPAQPDKLLLVVIFSMLLSPSHI